MELSTARNSDGTITSSAEKLSLSVSKSLPIREVKLMLKMEMTMQSKIAKTETSANVIVVNGAVNTVHRKFV
jgi:hypothetical protein